MCIIVRASYIRCTSASQTWAQDLISVVRSSYDARLCSPPPEGFCDSCWLASAVGLLNHGFWTRLRSGAYGTATGFWCGHDKSAADLSWRSLVGQHSQFVGNRRVSFLVILCVIHLLQFSS